MRFGETWPAPQTGGGPAITPPAPARPVRDRHARVLAYEIARDRIATRILNTTPEPGCPDCTAAAGEWCDPWCLRFQSGR